MHECRRSERLTTTVFGKEIKVTVGKLKESLDGINDNAEVFVGCEIGNRKFKIVGCEHPTGKKDKWDYIKLEYE